MLNKIASINSQRNENLKKCIVGALLDSLYTQKYETEEMHCGKMGKIFAGYRTAGSLMTLTTDKIST